ncbi:MAG: hypothetical protein ABW221_19500 [Vicinamibacteria bacterium]
MIPLAALLAQAAAAVTGPQGIEAERPAIVETYQGVEIAHTFVLRNQGARAARVLGVEPESPGGFVESVPSEPIPPGGRAEVAVRQDTAGRLGLGGFRFLLKADDGLPARRLVLTAFVQSAYDPDRPGLAGDPAPGGVVETRIESRLVPRLTVTDVSGVPAFLAVAALPGPDGAVLLRATVAADAPLGLQTGRLRLRTNVAAQPELVVPYRLAIFGDVVPEAPSVDLGSVRQGQSFAKSLLLRSRSGRPVEVVAVEGAGPGVAATVAACAEPAVSCRQLALAGTGGDPAAGLAGAVRLRFREGPALTIPYAGLVFGSDAVVRDLGRVDAPAVGAPAPLPTPPPIPPPVTGRPGERRARLVWDAAQEDQTYGYSVYRAESREGPFLRVNARVVPVGAGPAPGAYAYEDDTVEPGRSYFYYLESVSRGGVKTRLSGVVTKVIPPAP